MVGSPPRAAQYSSYPSKLRIGSGAVYFLNRLLSRCGMDKLTSRQPSRVARSAPGVDGKRPSDSLTRPFARRVQGQVGTTYDKAGWGLLGAVFQRRGPRFCAMAKTTTAPTSTRTSTTV